MSKKIQSKEREYYPALRGVFGDWVYYCCLMSVADVASRLSFADEIHKSKKLSDWIQRKLKEGRGKQIGEYLNREPERFFNSLVVAIYGGNPSWHGFAKFKAQRPDINLADVSDEVEDSVGFLSFTGKEHLFAIDGQHRLAGIKEALKRNAELGRDDLSMLLVAHTKSKTGQVRTRRLFTTLNKTAKPVGKGEIIALDEDDAMAIITRDLIENHPWFSEDRIKFSQNESIPADAVELTTIGNLYDILTVLFTECDTEKKKKAVLRSIRPTDDELAAYRSLAVKFFETLAAQCTDLRSYFQKPLYAAERFVAKQRARNGGHILFRPVGLRIFAEVAGALVKAGESLEDAFSALAKLPVELSDPPYLGIIWLPNGTMNPANRPLCRSLLLYMLGFQKDHDSLRTRYAKALGEARSKVALPEL